MAKELAAHRRFQSEERLAAGSEWQANDLVVATRDGRHVSPRNFDQSLERIVTNAGVPRLTSHGLRHTAATHMVRHASDIGEIRAAGRCTGPQPRHADEDLRPRLARVRPYCHRQDWPTRLGRRVSSRPDRLLLIDESDDIVHGGRKYVVACAVVLAGDAQAVGARLRDVLNANPDRTRPFHWSSQGPELRKQMIGAVASLAEVSFAVIGEVVDSRGQELVRYDCMRALLKLAGGDAAEIVIESRERMLRNVGQNRTDHRAIVDARHAGDVSPLMRYRWADKTDPLVWAPDAIAGMALATRRANPRWLDLFTAAGGDLRVVDIAP